MSVVPEQEHEAELPERWSAKAKGDVVLRLLRGRSMEAVSREVQVPAHEREACRRTCASGC
jgi:hypothetical protein